MKTLCTHSCVTVEKNRRFSCFFSSKKEVSFSPLSPTKHEKSFQRFISPAFQLEVTNFCGLNSDRSSVFTDEVTLKSAKKKLYKNIFVWEKYKTYFLQKKTFFAICFYHKRWKKKAEKSFYHHWWKFVVGETYNEFSNFHKLWLKINEQFDSDSYLVVGYHVDD